MSDRLRRRFAALGVEGRSGLVTFVTAGDPDLGRSGAILGGLPQAGADIIELGIPFSDPMADGPAIQAANLRALKSGVTVARTLDLVRAFRQADQATPLVLMGYYNPIHAFGPRRFLDAASGAGVDGLIVVDLPPEEDDICRPAQALGLSVIRLATPTTDDRRLPVVLANSSGFIYYVSLAGITGVGQANAAEVEPAIARLRRHTELPVAVGFGIRTAEQAQAIAKFADGTVVGSALVEAGAKALKAAADPVASIHGLARSLAKAVRAARQIAARQEVAS